MTHSTINDVEDLIKLHEGLRLQPYRCTADKLTIGYGRNLDDNGITEREADFLLAEDIRNTVIELQERLPFWEDLDDVRQAVLIDMCFNLGWPRLAGFKNFLAALSDEAYELAAREMLDSRWARQVGERAVRLSKIMRTGEWPSV